jgi:hypothetical protein
MARPPRHRPKLRATVTALRRKGKGRAQASASAPSSRFWIGVSSILALVLLWFFDPVVAPSSSTAVNPGKVRELATEHPDAEVFDLSDEVKKK